tara:strand:+ start:5674 stop:6408 length:735 start_codon:yes stop_codon:yes gene_type:complete
MIVEVCTDDVNSITGIKQSQINRVELCSALELGGLTPSLGVAETFLAELDIPIRVMIRPRRGHFTYSDAELNTMKNDIKVFKTLGVEGLVFGCLTAQNHIDRQALNFLLEAAEGLKVTFHRAFDWVDDPLESLSILDKEGVDTLLTSGLKDKAALGLELLLELKKKADNITLMPGSGIGKQEATLFKRFNFEAIHLSGTTFEPTSIGVTKPKMSMLSNPLDFELRTLQLDKLMEVVKIANEKEI